MSDESQSVTEYRAVGIYSNGRQRDEFAWTDRGAAAGLARKLDTGRFYTRAIVEARDVSYGPVRVVDEGDQT